jgi:Cu(I)-responsive transcriptional regulator
MNIGDTAAASGLTSKAIRYYEDIGLLPSPARGSNGYRRYGARDIRILTFLRRARGLGFGVEECRELMALYSDQERKSADVKAIALARVAEIDRKIIEMESLKGALEDLAERCHGDDRPDCPILEDLAATGLAGQEKSAGAPVKETVGS